MKTLIRIFSGVVFSLGLIYAVAVLFLVPKLAKNGFTKAVQDECASCKFELGSVSFDFFDPSQMRLLDLRLKQGEAGASELLIRIESILVDVDLLKSLSREPISVSSVDVQSPDVLLIDGDGSSDGASQEKKSAAEQGDSPQKSSARATPDDRSASGGPLVTVESVNLKDGVFTYTRSTAGTIATLHLAKIDGTVSRLSNTPGLRDQFVDAHLRAQIEKSGETEVDVRLPMSLSTDHVDVSVYIRDQDLSRLNAFFNPNAGVELQGKIARARGRVRVRGRALTASTWIVYHGLELKLSSMHDRTKAEAFLMNVGADLVMKETDLGLDGKDQTETFSAAREPGEPTVGFILRGLKEAAIGVARKSPDQRETKVAPRPDI